MGPLLLLILLFAIAWVVLILPKQRELKRHKALVASLEVGDDVMTGSGFYGTLVEVTDDTVVLQMAPGVEVKLARRAVAAKLVGTTDPAMAEVDAATAESTDDDEQTVAGAAPHDDEDVDE